ncbi:MAG: SRPBCC family protein [Xanthobacteraceae bacterium]
MALASGDPVVDIRIDSTINAARIHSLIDIPVPPEVVWKLMLDCEHSKRVVPGMESCRVLQRDPAGRWDIREHVINWAWFMPRARNVFRSDYSPPLRLTFRRIEGDLRQSSGEWRLEPLDNGRTTRVHYNSTISADVPAPNFIVVEALRRDLTTVMKNLRSECIAAYRGRPQ